MLKIITLKAMGLVIDQVREERDFCNSSGHNGLGTTLTATLNALTQAYDYYERVIQSASWLEERQLQRIEGTNGTS